MGPPVADWVGSLTRCLAFDESERWPRNGVTVATLGPPTDKPDRSLRPHPASLFASPVADTGAVAG